MRKFINCKKVFLISIFVVLLIILGTTNSEAVLQANPTTHVSPVSKVGAAWISEIRQMETVGQTMGLKETLNGLDATSDSNNIDIHMILPNEYGAITILSVSGYGNSGKLLDETVTQKRTTTGNPTGVYFTGDRWEALAAYAANYSCSGKYMHNDKADIGSCFRKEYGLGWHGGGDITYGMGDQYNHLYQAGGRGLFSIHAQNANDHNGGSWFIRYALGRGIAVISNGI